MTTTLGQLGVGTQTFPDTARFDYASFLRDQTGKDLGPLVDGTKGLTGLTVALVGGGIANIVAAYELARCGIQVTVFERSSRLGGRLDTEPGPEDRPPFELGAMRFPAESRLFWHYVRAWAHFRYDGHAQDPDAITPRQLPDEDLNDLLAMTCCQNDWFVHTPSWAKARPAVREAWVMWQSFLNNLNDGYASPMTTYLPAIRIAARRGGEAAKVQLFWRRMAQRYEHKSVGEVMQTEAFASRPQDIPQLMRMLFALGSRNSGVRGLFEVGFLEILRNYIWAPGDYFALPAKADWPDLDHGTTGFATGLAELAHKQSDQWKVRPFAEMFRTAATVNGLTYDQASNKIQVQLKTSPPELFDFAIVAMSSRAMQAIGLDQDTPTNPFRTTQPVTNNDSRAALESVQAAIHQLDLTSAVRLVVPMDQPDSIQNWPVNAAGEKLTTFLTDRYPRQTTVMPSVGLSTRTHALVSALGNDALKFQAKTVDQMRTSAASAFDPQDTANEWPQAVVGSTFRQAKGFFAADWNRVAMSRGAFKLDRPGQTYLSGALLHLGQLSRESDIKPYARVFLAGDSVGHLGGWVEGSMMSALHATTAVLTQIKKQAGKQDWRIRTQDLLDPEKFEFRWRRLSTDAAARPRLRGMARVADPSGNPAKPGTWRYDVSGSEACTLVQVAISQDGWQMLGANADGSVYHRLFRDGGGWDPLAPLTALPRDPNLPPKAQDIAISTESTANQRLTGQAYVLAINEQSLLWFCRRVDDTKWTAWEKVLTNNGTIPTAKRVAVTVGGPRVREARVFYIEPSGKLWHVTRVPGGVWSDPKQVPGMGMQQFMTGNEVAIAAAYDAWDMSVIVAVIDVNLKIQLILQNGTSSWGQWQTIPLPKNRLGADVMARKVSVVGSAMPGRGQLVMSGADGNAYHRLVDLTDPTAPGTWHRASYPLAAPYAFTDLAVGRAVGDPCDPEGTVTLWGVGDLTQPQVDADPQPDEMAGQLDGAE